MADETRILTGSRRGTFRAGRPAARSRVKLAASFSTGGASGTGGFTSAARGNPRTCTSSSLLVPVEASVTGGLAGGGRCTTSGRGGVGRGGVGCGLVTGCGWYAGLIEPVGDMLATVVV